MQEKAPQALGSLGSLHAFCTGLSSDFLSLSLTHTYRYSDSRTRKPETVHSVKCTFKIISTLLQLQDNGFLVYGSLNTGT